MTTSHSQANASEAQATAYLQASQAFADSLDRWWGKTRPVEPIDRHDAIIEPLDRLTYVAVTLRDRLLRTEYEGDAEVRERLAEILELRQEITASFFRILREFVADCVPESMLPMAASEIDHLEGDVYALFREPGWDEHARNARRRIWNFARRWPPFFRSSRRKQDEAEEPQLPPLDPKAVEVLGYLYLNRLHRKTQREIKQGLGMDVKTVKERVRQLVDLELVEKAGEGGTGYGITAPGRKHARTLLDAQRSK